MKKYKRCPVCGRAEFNCICEKPAAHVSTQPNLYSAASLGEIVAQLRSCGYRCEAGPIELNLAFIELERRTQIEV